MKACTSRSGFGVVLGNQTQGLMLGRQALYQLSYTSSWRLVVLKPPYRASIKMGRIQAGLYILCASDLKGSYKYVINIEVLSGFQHHTPYA